jgi:hypothetical protein
VTRRSQGGRASDLRRRAPPRHLVDATRVVLATRVVTTVAPPGCPTGPGRCSRSRARRRAMACLRPLRRTGRLLPPLFRLFPARLPPPAVPVRGLVRARVRLVRFPRCRASAPRPPRRPTARRPRRPTARRPLPPRRPRTPLPSLPPLPLPRPRRPPLGGPLRVPGSPALVRPEPARQDRVRPDRAPARRARAARKARKARKARRDSKAAGKAARATATAPRARPARARRAREVLVPLVPGSAVRGLVRGQETTRSARRRPAWAPPRLPAPASAASAPSALTVPTAPTGAIVVRVLAWVAAPVPARAAPAIAVPAGQALQPAAALPATVARVPAARVPAVRDPAR